MKKEDSSSSESSEESSDEEESDFTKSLRQKFGLQKGEPIPSTSARLLQKAKSPSVASKKQKSKSGRSNGQQSGSQEQQQPSSSFIGEKDSSIELGRECLEWMIAPVKFDDFFHKSWEKRPLHIKRGKPGICPPPTTFCSVTLYQMSSGMVACFDYVWN